MKEGPDRRAVRESARCKLLIADCHSEAPTGGLVLADVLWRLDLYELSRDPVRARQGNRRHCLLADAFGVEAPVRRR